MSSYLAKPAYPRIDHGHQLATGLRAYFTPPRLWGETQSGGDISTMAAADLVNPRNELLVSGHKNTPTINSPYGPAFWNDGNEEIYLNGPSPSDIPDNLVIDNTVPFTVLVAGRVQPGAVVGAGDNVERWVLYWLPTNVLAVQLDDDVNKTQNYANAPSQAGDWTTFGISVTSSSVRPFAAGAARGSFANLTGQINVTGKGISLTHHPSRGGNGVPAVVAIWIGRALSDADYALFHADPFAMVRPKRSLVSMFVDAGGGGGGVVYNGLARGRHFGAFGIGRPGRAA